MRSNKLLLHSTAVHCRLHTCVSVCLIPERSAEKAGNERREHCLCFLLLQPSEESVALAASIAFLRAAAAFVRHHQMAQESLNEYFLLRAHMFSFQMYSTLLYSTLYIETKHKTVYTSIRT